MEPEICIKMLKKMSAGLSLRAGDRGFPPGTSSLSPATLDTKQKHCLKESKFLQMPSIAPWKIFGTKPCKETRRIFAFTRALCWGETLVLLHVVSQGFFCNDGLSCNCFCIGMLEMQGYYLCIQVTLL